MITPALRLLATGAINCRSRSNRASSLRRRRSGLPIGLPPFRLPPDRVLPVDRHDPVAVRIAEVVEIPARALHLGDVVLPPPLSQLQGLPGSLRGSLLPLFRSLHHV